MQVRPSRVASAKAASKLRVRSASDTESDGGDQLDGSTGKEDMRSAEESDEDSDFEG